MDLDDLGVWLASDAAPDTAMSLAELDGFLTGLIVGPDPIRPATCPRESVLLIRLRPDFSVVFEGYVHSALHWRPRLGSRTRSLEPDILRTSRLRVFGVEPVTT